MRVAASFVALGLVFLAACGGKKQDESGDDGKNPDVPLTDVAKVVTVSPKDPKETKRVGEAGKIEARTTFAYEGKKRLERIEYREGGEKKKSSTKFAFDGDLVTTETESDFAEDGTAKVVGVKTYTYDGKGRITKWRKWTGAESAVTERTVERDESGRITQVKITDASGEKTTKSYDWAARTLTTETSQEGAESDKSVARYAFFENGYDDVAGFLQLKLVDNKGDSTTESKASCTQDASEPFKFACEETTTVDGKKVSSAKRTTALITFEGPDGSASEPIEVKSEQSNFDATGKATFTSSNDNEFNDVWKLVKGTSVQINVSLDQKQTYVTEASYDDGGNLLSSKFLENGKLLSTETSTY